METTLLLNAGYEPLRLISWQRAVTLSFLGKVEVVNTYDREVRSVSLSVRVPSVVRLLRFVKLGSRRPPLSKPNLLARDKYSCRYCGIELPQKDATVDHVIPRSQGGITCWENVVIACHTCNRRKGGRTPAQARMKLLSPAVAPEWLPVLNIRLHKNLPECWLIFLSKH